MNTTVPNTSKKDIRIIFSIIIIIICYVGAWIAIHDITHSLFWATPLAGLTCLDFVLAHFVLKDANEPDNVWYWFAAILLVGAFASTLVWWSLGIASIRNEVAVFGAGIVFVLRLVVVNILGGDDDHGFLV